MRRLTNVALIAGIVLLLGLAVAIGSRRTSQTEAFGGTDAAATQLVEAGHPNYRPWFAPVFQPGSAEVESGLFAAQAALGGVLVGYCIGALHTRRRLSTLGPSDRAETPDQTDAATPDHCGRQTPDRSQ